MQLLGLAGASYSLSTWSSPLQVFSPARAAEATVPRRIVFFYTEQGAIKQFKNDGTLVPF